MHCAYLAISSPIISDKDICVAAINTRVGETIVDGNGGRKELNQLEGVFGLFIDENKTIYVADRNSNRVVKWEHGDQTVLLISSSIKMKQSACAKNGHEMF